MPKPADIGTKRLVSLAPDAWVRWVTQCPDAVAQEILTPEFEWVSRQSDVLMRAYSPRHGEFILVNEVGLRYRPHVPRRMQAYAALAEERHSLPVYPVLVNVLAPGRGTLIPDRYESEFMGLRARRDYRVLNLWEVDAQVVFDQPLPSLLPFVPVLRGGGDEQVVQRALHALRADETLDELEPLLAFFATFVLQSSVVQQIMRWDMAVLMESPWYNEILDEGIRQGVERGRQQGRQEGWQEGVLEKAWEDILDALGIRFGQLSPAVVEAVHQVRDPSRLRELLRQAVQAASLDEFVRALGT